MTSRTLTRGWPRKPEQRCLGVAGDGRPDVGLGHPARSCDAGDLVLGALAGLMSGSRPEAEVVTRSTGIGASPFAARRPSTWSWIRSIRAGFVGPRFEPAEAFAS